MLDDSKPLTKNAQIAIHKGNKTIEEFKAHSTGRLNLWTSINNLYGQYVITAECEHRLNPGITTAIVAHLLFNKYSEQEYLDILMSLQKKWAIPVLTHQWPKKLLFNMRNKYGSDIIRDDIVRKY